MGVPIRALSLAVYVGTPDFSLRLETKYLNTGCLGSCISGSMVLGRYVVFGHWDP